MGNLRSKNWTMSCFAVVLIAILTVPISADWKPGKVPLMTKWADEVSPDNVHPEYPRPQMVRKDWQNLNGLWDYAIVPKGQQPQEFDGKILVPFPAESALSGVTRPVGIDNCLWYRREFAVPNGFSGKRILLHFGAVDWDTTIWINGVKVGEHKGCYDSFSFDITDTLKKTGSQEIVLRVWDPTDTGAQPRGKQVTKPKGICYTAVTGIWQTVWLEPVEQSYIEKIQLVPDIDASVVFVKVNTNKPGSGLSVEATVLKDSQPVTMAMGKAGVEFALKIEKPQLWSVDSPFLYGLEVSLRDGDKTLDKIESYFGMRKISFGKDQDGFLRMFLNNEPLFQYGPLDQGWWPDGLYTAPTDEALKYDIEILKMLGFNMMRKHVKIEPARFYYHCDKLGLLVWQDMPNGNPDNKLEVRSSDPEDAKRTPESAMQFETELKAMIDGLANHPSIIAWVVFNEGWGQYDTGRLTQWVKLYDSTR
ncbi:MAG: glycoside hydrolase family 2 protein, partial [Planctomycetota bacterium]